MTKEERILGQADAESKQGAERLEVHKNALDAKEKADVEQLFAAYEASIKDRKEFEEVFLRAMLLMKKPEELGNPIMAIRDVALAAIDLARDVALGKEKS